MNPYEITKLATYNGERSRGIQHTPEYAERMAALQRRFDEHMARLDADIERGREELQWERAIAPRRWERVFIAVCAVAAVLGAAYAFAQWVMA